MIPLGDVIPVRVRPFMTFAAMAAVIATGGPLLHIVASLMALGLFGRTVEDRTGHGRFAVFVLLCGSVAVVAQVLAGSRNVPAALAVSGGVAAVVGAYFTLYPFSKVLVLVPMGLTPRIFELDAIVFGAVWYMLEAISWLPSASAWAPVPGLVPSWTHLAGMAAGAAGVWIFRRPERLRVEWWHDSQRR